MTTVSFEETKGRVATNIHHITAQSAIIRVLIAEGHFLTAALVGNILNASGEFTTEHTADLDETMSVLRMRGPFDIVLLDTDMPGMFTSDCITEVIAANSGGKVVLFTGSQRSAPIYAAIDEGGYGGIPKTVSTQTLINALKFIHAGEIYLPKSMLLKSREERSHNLALRLTERERIILKGLATGMTNRFISKRLGISELSVKSYVSNLMHKLGCENRTQVAIYAVKNGIT